jgi:hypothetical protein
MLAAALALAVGASASDADPEPLSKTKDEAATPAIDLEKAKKDAKLADQASRNQKASTSNLRELGLAMHNYHAGMNRLPVDIKDRNGKSLLSWRVALLPYLGQKKLYEEFKLDEPWDSRHNIKLLNKMPNVFRSPRVALRSKSNTVYQVFTGANAVFGHPRPLGLAQIPDGTSNTIFAVEWSNSVPWTKPADIPFDRKKALPEFGKAYGKRPLAVMFDGSTRVLNLEKITEATLKNAIDPLDGNVLGKDWDQ